jgi:antitoxin component HigA of HigAB toxin-antitoxin module
MRNRVTKILAAIAALPPSYLALLAEFPLRPIRNGSEYNRAAKIVHRLALREGRLDEGEEAYLEVLETLVERCDEKNNPLDTEDVTPTRVLRMLVEQAGMTVTELGELLGSKGAASELLSGKRQEPSKAQIARLCARFKVGASAFLLPATTSAPANAA